MINSKGRYCFSIDIYDNQEEKEVISEGFNTDNLALMIQILTDTIEELKQNERCITDVSRMYQERREMKPKTMEKEKKTKPNCYKCKWRGEVAGSAHSSCHHPKCKSIEENPMLNLLSILGGVRGGVPPLPTGLKVKGDPHGIKSGWFNHPLNFDPVWLEECDGFELKEE